MTFSEKGDKIEMTDKSKDDAGSSRNGNIPQYVVETTDVAVIIIDSIYDVNFTFNIVTISSTFWTFVNVDERHKPHVNDIHYNVNEIEKLKAQGIETSGLTVAESAISGRGTMGNTNDWTQTDPADGKVVIAWSVMENYPYEDETTQFMADLRTVQNNLSAKVARKNHRMYCPRAILY